MKYKHIIFDLGAVLFDINYQYTTDAFVKLGLTNFDEIYSKQKHHPDMSKVCSIILGGWPGNKALSSYEEKLQTCNPLWRPL